MAVKQNKSTDNSTPDSESVDDDFSWLPLQFFFSLGEACRTLNTGRTRGWKLRKAGIIRTVKFGGREVVTRNELIRIARSAQSTAEGDNG